MRAGIALGSNLGDRRENLRRAQDAILCLTGIQADDRPLLAPVFETRPVDCPPGTPPFLNTVMEVECSLLPRELLERLRGIETAFGRPAQRERNASRTLDADLLYAGDQQLDTPALTLPHPRIAERQFVLEPLAAIRPDLILPGQSRSVAELLAALPVTVS